MPDVEIDGSNTVLSFPDSMSPEAIRSVLAKHPTVQKLKAATIASQMMAGGVPSYTPPKPPNPYRPKQKKSRLDLTVERQAKEIGVNIDEARERGIDPARQLEERRRADAEEKDTQERIVAQQKRAQQIGGPALAPVPTAQDKPLREKFKKDATVLRKREEAKGSTLNRIVPKFDEAHKELKGVHRGLTNVAASLFEPESLATMAAGGLAIKSLSAGSMLAPELLRKIGLYSGGLGVAQSAADVEAFKRDKGEYAGQILGNLGMMVPDLLSMGKGRATAKAEAKAAAQPRTERLPGGGKREYNPLVGSVDTPQPPIVSGKFKQKQIAKRRVPQEIAPNIQENIPAPANEIQPAEAKRVSRSTSQELMNPDDIGVLEGMQYKKEGITDSKNAVGDTLKGTDVYDVDQGGALTVWRDKKGKTWAVNGHHRGELARRADKFVKIGPDGQPVEVPREVPVNVLNEADGWTMQAARARGALENIRDGKGTALDALEVMQNLGVRTPEQYKEIGVSLNSDTAKNLIGLQSLDEQALLRVRMGDVPEHVAAGIGSVDGLTPEAQRGALDEAIREKSGTYAKARRLAEHYLDDQQSGRLAQEAGNDLFGGEFSTATSTRAVRVELEEAARRLLKAQRSDLLKPADAKLREGEAIDAAGRKSEAQSMAESQRALDERLNLLYRQDSVKEAVANFAAEVGNGRLDKRIAGQQLAAILQPHTGRSVRELADPRGIHLDPGGSVGSPLDTRNASEPVQPGEREGLFAQEAPKGVASEQPNSSKTPDAANVGGVARTDAPVNVSRPEPALPAANDTATGPKASPQEAPAQSPVARTVVISDAQGELIQSALGYDHPLSQKIEAAFADGKTSKANVGFSDEELATLRDAAKAAEPEAKAGGVSLTGLNKQIGKPAAAPMSRQAQADFAQHTLVAENDRGAQVYKTKAGQYLYRDPDGNVTTTTQGAATKMLNASRSQPQTKLPATKGSKPGAFQFGAKPGSPADKVSQAVSGLLPNKKQKAALAREKKPSAKLANPTRTPLSNVDAFGDTIGMPGSLETRTTRTGNRSLGMEVNERFLQAADQEFTITQKYNRELDGVLSLLDEAYPKMKRADRDNAFIDLIERDFTDSLRAKANNNPKLQDALTRYDALTGDVKKYIYDSMSDYGTPPTDTQGNVIPLDKWGITEKGFFHHLFLGELRLYDAKTGAEIHSDHGFWNNYAEAQAHVNKALKADPTAQFKIEARDITAGDPSLRVTGKQYHGAVERVKDRVNASGNVSLSHAEIMADFAGTLGTKGGKRKFLGALQKRKGATGFTRDFEKVMRGYGAAVARTQELTKLQHDLYRQNGLVERLKTAGETGTVKDVEKMMYNLWGSPTTLDEHFGFGVRSLASNAARAQNFLKLDWNISSSLANTLQPLSTLWPEISTKEFAAVYADYMKPATRQRLRDAGVFEGATKIEAGGNLTVKSKKVPIFQQASAMNRGIGYLAGERIAVKKAQAKGVTLTPEMKHRNGMAWAQQTEFGAGKYWQAPILRGAGGQFFGQYKSFPLKMNEHLAHSVKPRKGDTALGYAGRNAKLAAGTLVPAGVKAAGIIGKTALGLAAIKALSSWAQSLGLSKRDADAVAAYGAFGAAGVDMSQKIGVLEPPFGSSPKEQIGGLLLGPTAGGAIDAGVRLYQGKRQQALEGISPLIKQARTGYQMATRQGRAMEKVDGNTYSLNWRESLGQALGFAPVRKSQRYDRLNAR